eukprot:c1314_g1_i1.p1 GENE.c1314_g1_i1~~c1314_g1_i1.p1  ORF type:complete len:217 (-),score=55.05 c1314_g1_i1:184-774(-)
MATGTASASALAAAVKAGTTFQFTPSLLKKYSKEILAKFNASDAAAFQNLLKEVESTPNGVLTSSHMTTGTGFWRCGLTRNMNELRFILCVNSESSSTLRKFVGQEYDDLKYHNPYLPIMIREGPEVEPKIVARFDYGNEIVIPVTGFTPAMLWETIHLLNTRGKLQDHRTPASKLFQDFIVDRPAALYKLANPPL